MGHEIALATAVGIYALGILAGALSFIPGGLGSTEAVLILLLLVAGLDTPDAAAATLICRVATLWFAVLLGILATGWIEIRQQVRRPRRRAVPQDGSGPSG
jgi:uncharacterized protein (TIRG00374 family)